MHSARLASSFAGVRHVRIRAYMTWPHRAEDLIRAAGRPLPPAIFSVHVVAYGTAPVTSHEGCTDALYEIDATEAEPERAEGIKCIGVRRGGHVRASVDAAR